MQTRIKTWTNHITLCKACLETKTNNTNAESKRRTLTKCHLCDTIFQCYIIPFEILRPKAEYPTLAEDANEKACKRRRGSVQKKIK